MAEFPWHSSHLQNVSTLTYPCVVKIGHGVRGKGKIRVADAAQMADVCSVVEMGDYGCTIEPFIEAKYDIHVHRIGDVYTAYV